ncbi:MAG: AcvB/VirJ family lysyl-phosphatidylglycerol hydrolase [archaeon]
MVNHIFNTIKYAFYYAFPVNVKDKFDNIVEENLSYVKNQKGDTVNILVFGVEKPHYAAGYRLLRWFNKKDLRIIPVEYELRFNPSKSSEVIERGIKEVLRDTRKKKVNLLAFSFGGIVARRYVEELAEKKIINKFITVCSPLNPLKKGEDFAYFVDQFIYHRLEDAQNILKRLKGKNSINKYIAIYGLRDKIISPETATSNKVKCIAVDCGHIVQMFDERILKIILNYLKRGNNEK